MKPKEKLFIQNKGITILSLIVSVIILLILLGVTINISINGGILLKNKKAAFYTEMNGLEEEKQLYELELWDKKNTGDITDTTFLGENVSKEKLVAFSDSLKAEIAYMRNAPGAEINTKTIWKNNSYNCKDIFLEENLDKENDLISNLYYLKRSKDYIYDKKTDTIYKVKDTKLGKYTVHSLLYAKLMLDGIGFSGYGIVETEVSVITASDGTMFYEPNLNNFTYDTKIIYYSNTLDTYEVDVKDYLRGGKKNSIDKNRTIYTFANYVDKSSAEPSIWANIKCTANNLETNWVWIPRYAYKLDSTTQSSDIIFVDLNGNPLDTIKYGETLPEGYTLHEAFAQDDGLYGIWFSKYEPSYILPPKDSTEPNAPDLSNFNSEETTLIYYNPNNLEDIKERPFSLNPEQTYTENRNYILFL